MLKLTGNTYTWKTELSREGFRFNGATKTWDREKDLPATEADCEFFAEKQLLRAIESGELKVYGGTSAASNRKPTNAREAMEFESGVKYE